jgi:hypothetical protein
MSKIYTLKGKIEALVDCVDGDKAFFRKALDQEDPAAHVERLVCMVLMDNPCKNVVSVYNVGEDYIDVELLDTTHEDTTTRAKDVKEALEQLHERGVVYVDLKWDNMGFSHTDGVWKLFDFDGCGMYSKKDRNHKWLLPPPMRFKIYKELAPVVQEKYGGDNLAFDKLAYRRLFSSKDNVDKAKDVKADNSHRADNRTQREDGLAVASTKGLDVAIGCKSDARLGDKHNGDKKHVK